MESKTIFSKTAKGLREASGASSDLPRAMRTILKSIDGKTNLAQLRIKLEKYSEADLKKAMQSLESEGYIRDTGQMSGQPSGQLSETVIPLSKAQAAKKQVTESFDDLDFTSLAAQPSAEDVRKEAEARASREAKQREELMAQAKARQAAEEKARRDSAEKARIEAEEKARHAMLVKAKHEAEEKARRETAEKARIEAEVRARKEAEEKARREVEEKARREVEERTRREAEERARREAAEKARQEAEERARVEAEERARIEAQQRAKRMAEEQARREAEEKLKREAAEKARLEAIEKTRKEAAERERIETEAQARREAEIAAQKATEEKLRLESEARIRKEAEEREHLEREKWEARETEARLNEAAEEKLRREAEDLARKAAEAEAETQARREAKEQARREQEEKEVQAQREAEESAKREAEQIARQEAEALARKEAEEREARAQWQAEEAKERDRLRRENEAKTRVEAEMVRREAEELAKREAEKKERMEAWERSKRKAEEKLRLETEESARRKADERVNLEVIEREQREATAKAKEIALMNETRTEPELGLRSTIPTIRDVATSVLPSKLGKNNREDEFELRLDGDDRAKRKAREASLLRTEEIVNKTSERFARLADIYWGKVIAGVLITMSMITLARIHVVSYDSLIPELEQAASAQFQQPVKIESLYFSLLPRPRWRLEGMVIGAANEIRAQKVDAVIDLTKLLSDRRAFDRFEIESPVLKETALAWLIFGKPQQRSFRVASMMVSNAELDSPNIMLPRFNAKVDVGPDGHWQKIALDFSNKDVFVELLPNGDRVQFDVNAIVFLPPFGGTFAFNDFTAKGSFGSKELVVKEFEGRNFGGTFTGTANLSWADGWRIDGTINAKQPNAKNLIPALIGRGYVDGNATFSMLANDAKTLFVVPHLEGSFVIGQGVLLGIDLMHQLKNAADSGKTEFRQLNGGFVRHGNTTQLRSVRLDAGMLSATGSAEMDANEVIRGRFGSSITFDDQKTSGAFTLSGTLSEPKFSR